MGAEWWWGHLCLLGIFAARCRGVSQCLDGITFNVILLDDEESPWSLKYVKREILKAIEKDKSMNVAEGKKRGKYCTKMSVCAHIYGTLYTRNCSKLYYCTFYSKTCQTPYLTFGII